MKLLLTRPEPGLTETSQSLISAGHDVICEPLFSCEPIAHPSLDLSHYSGLVFTSSNGVRTFNHDDEKSDIATFTVGDKTASIAVKANYSRVLSASGNVTRLTELVQNTLKSKTDKLLYVAGVERAGSLDQDLEKLGYRVQLLETYRMVPKICLTFQTVVAFQNQQISGILFYSPRAARLFCNLARNQLDLNTLKRITAFCLSARVAGELDVQFEKTCVAELPDETSILDLVAQT
ncbi:MAG: uroporphyrinogen-III synthase [Cohaesibacteraceae bacterium]|nr:uroporphyrinogen-III synthase [Cohaesibacteraceae bacterium]